MMILMMIVGAHNPWAPTGVSAKREAGPGSGLVYLFFKDCCLRVGVMLGLELVSTLTLTVTLILILTLTLKQHSLYIKKSGGGVDNEDDDGDDADCDNKVYYYRYCTKIDFFF